MIQVQHISAHAHKDSGFWQVVDGGAVIKKFFGENARDEASEYANLLAGGPSDDQLLSDRYA